jgi:hypothetical protein
LRLQKWEAPFDGFTYGGKPIVDHDGNPVFAEFALLRMMLADKTWDGVWVETYGGTNFLQENARRVEVEALEYGPAA